MLGYIWFFFILAAIIIGGINGRIDAVVQSIVDSSKLAVEISISLIGVMAFWLGMMKLAEKSGIVSLISKLIKPITKRLFSDIPPDHPAIGHVAMNFTANALGVTKSRLMLCVHFWLLIQRAFSLCLLLLLQYSQRLGQKTQL